MIFPKKRYWLWDSEFLSLEFLSISSFPPHTYKILFLGEKKIWYLKKLFLIETRWPLGAEFLSKKAFSDIIFFFCPRNSILYVCIIPRGSGYRPLSFQLRCSASFFPPNFNTLLIFRSIGPGIVSYMDLDTIIIINGLLTEWSNFI